MLNSFTFNGRTSTEFGIKVEKMPTLNRSARKFRAASVPGHNGNIYELQDAWEEIVQPYQIFAGDRNSNAVSNFSDIAEWLHSADGYAVLTDTYDPTHYREAVFVDSLDIESAWHTLGRTTVNFRCRPERYLVGVPEAISNGSVIVNGTNHAAKPLIHLTGTNAANHMPTLYGRISTTVTAGYLDTLTGKYPPSRSYKAVGLDLMRTGRIPADPNGVTSSSSTTSALTYTALYSFGIGLPASVRPSTQYTLSYNVSNDNHGAIDTAIFYFDRFSRYLAKNTVKHAAYDTSQYITFTTPSDCAYIMLLVTGDADTYVLSNVMLAYGSEALPYSQWHNPHDYFDAPAIAISGVKLTIGEDFLTCDIDCENEDVYLEGVLSNTVVSVTENGEITPNFITLKSGNNPVTMTTNITGGTIEKRLWEL